MLSKEEIENKIYSFHKYMRNQAEDEIMQEYWEDIKQYIDQLESDKQKLIEKLEEDKETLKKENSDGTLQDYVIRLLEILKGE